MCGFISKSPTPQTDYNNGNNYRYNRRYDYDEWNEVST